MNEFIKVLQEENLLGTLIKDEKDIKFLESLNNIFIEEKISKQGKINQKIYYNWFVKLDNGEIHALNLSRTDKLYVKYEFNIYCKTCGKFIGKYNLGQIFSMKFNNTVVLNRQCYHECRKCSTKNNAIKGQEKSKKTCMEHFGVEYSFQSENNKRKSVETKLKKWGKDWKKIQASTMIDYWKNNKRIHHNGDDPVIRAKMVESWKRTVAKKSVEELKTWRNKIIGMSRSKISIEFFQKLSDVLNLKIEQEYTLKDDKRSYIVDGYLENICIFEFLGDYWHANPDIYNENDLLTYHKKIKLAKQVWQEDKNRFERYSKFSIVTNNFNLVERL